MKHWRLWTLLLVSGVASWPAKQDLEFFLIRVESSGGEPIDTTVLPKIVRVVGGTEATTMTPKSIRCDKGDCRVVIRSAEGPFISTDSSENPEGYWQLIVGAKDYEDALLGPYKLQLKDNQYSPADGSRMVAVLSRTASKWKPTFLKYQDLPRAFDDLKKKLEASPQTFIKLKGKPVNVGKFVGVDYDCPSGVEPVDEEYLRAKSALLNVYLCLRDSGQWLEYVSEIHMFNEERILGLAEEKMYTEVERLINENTNFSCGTARAANTILHDFKDPLLTGPIFKKPVSIKLPVCQGNLQLSVAGVKAGGADKYVFDIDIDEHFGTVFHLLDVGKHYASRRGTSAIEMGEMLLSFHRAQVGAGNGFSLGYKLVPRNSRKTHCSLVDDGTNAARGR